MTKKQVDSFLAGAHIARIATTKVDGAPFAVPVWYEWDGKHCYVVGRKRSAWIKNIEHEPRVTVLIDTDVWPTSKVIIEGKAKIVGRSTEDWVEIGKKMVKRYIGAEAGISYLEGSLDQPRVTIRVTPSKITTWTDPEKKLLEKKPFLAWHRRYYEPRSRFERDYLNDKGSKTTRKR